MNNTEEKFLHQLFSEEDCEMVDVPEKLKQNLYEIPKKQQIRRIPKLQIFTGLAASLLLAVLVNNTYQQTKQNLALEQTREELLVVFTYMEKNSEKAHQALSSRIDSERFKTTFPSELKIWDTLESISIGEESNES